MAFCLAGTVDVLIILIDCDRRTTQGNAPCGTLELAVTGKRGTLWPFLPKSSGVVCQDASETVQRLGAAGHSEWWLLQPHGPGHPGTNRKPRSGAWAIPECISESWGLAVLFLSFTLAAWRQDWSQKSPL